MTKKKAITREQAEAQRNAWSSGAGLMPGFMLRPWRWLGRWHE